jgi:hypothetical protein
VTAVAGTVCAGTDGAVERSGDDAAAPHEVKSKATAMVLHMPD